MRSAQEITDLFRRRGLKVTPQRQRIFEALSGNSAHPTAESVYAAVRAEMPTISLKTVYQTLHELVQLGEIQHLDLGTGSGRFDPNTDAHHHLVCTRCGKVRDYYANELRPAMPAGQPQGFTITSAEVTYRGLCTACKQETAGKP